MIGMNDQRSTIDQLETLYAIANKNGLYDAADVVRGLLEARRHSQASAAEQRINEKAQRVAADRERFLKRFMTARIESPAQKKALKAAGWISWLRAYGMWSLTDEGVAEAKRLGYL